jgi:hypothetical protein
MRSFRTLRRFALATWAACALFVVPSAHATAGLLPIPVPSVSVPSLLQQLPQLPLPTVSPLPLPSIPIVGGLLPSPIVTGVPAVPLPGQLNDTVGGIEGLLGLGGGTTKPSPGPVTGIGNGSTGQKSGTGHSPTGTKSGTAGGSGANQSHAGVSGLTTLDGIGIITPGEAFNAPYGTVTSQAVSKAAGRALHLAGPLAPPLMLAIFALAVLLMLSRGSTRLVKLDVAGLARRTWRI